MACSGRALSLPGIFYSFYFTELGVDNLGTISLLRLYQAIVAGAMTLLYGRAAALLSSMTIFIICMTCAALGLGTKCITSDWRIAAGLASGLLSLRRLGPPEA